MDGQEYTAQLTKLGGAEKIDRALDLLTESIATGAEAFELVGAGPLRLAKSDPFDLPGIRIPALRLFFFIQDKDNAVLLFVEQAEGES